MSKDPSIQYSPPLVPSDHPISMWVIYHSPKDHPGKTVARKWVVDRRGAWPTDEAAIDSLENLREQHRKMLRFRIPRNPLDDACIVESWI